MQPQVFFYFEKLTLSKHIIGLIDHFLVKKAQNSIIQVCWDDQVLHWNTQQAVESTASQDFSTSNMATKRCVSSCESPVLKTTYFLKRAHVALSRGNGPCSLQHWPSPCWQLHMIPRWHFLLPNLPLPSPPLIMKGWSAPWPLTCRKQ